MKYARAYAIGMLIVIAIQMVDNLILISLGGHSYKGRFLLSATGILWMLVSVIALPFFKLSKVPLLCPMVYVVYVLMTLAYGLTEMNLGLSRHDDVVPLWHTYVDCVAEIAFAFLCYPLLFYREKGANESSTVGGNL